MLLPVALRPMKSPLCVPRTEFKTATRSPSAKIAAIGSVRSGNAARSPAKYFLRVVRWSKSWEIDSVRSIYDDATSPVGYRANCIRYRRKRNREDHDVCQDGFLDGGRFHLRAQLANDIRQRTRPAIVGK